MSVECMGEKLIAKADLMPGGFFIYRADDSGEILFANEQVLKIFECDTYEEFYAYTGGTFRGMLGSNEWERTERDIASQIARHDSCFAHVTYYITTKKGKICYIENFGRLVEDADEGSLFYVFIVDAEVKSQNYRYDRVTGLMSMQCFLDLSDRLLTDMRYNKVLKNMAFVFLNVRNFKHYNIRYGLEAGDACLRRIGQILRQYFPQDLVARLNSDHFGIFTQEDELQKSINQVRCAVKALSDELLLELKAGVYSVKQDDLYKPVVAMDHAKIACDSIKNQVSVSVKYYSEDFNKKIEVYEYVASHIDVALERKWVKLYYQPVVRTITKHLCSMEVLARWIDPVYGFLNPGQFIGALEDSAQIHKLDSYVAMETCRMLRERMDQKLAVVPISFNLSRLDFLLCDIFQKIEDAVEKYRIPRYMLHIEITESMLIEDGDRMQAEIQKFHAAGYQVWMDDFGSGYSSLNVLKDYHFDEIKLDMMFLSSFSERSQAILTSVIDMAKKIGIQTLAEGVETEEQFEFLRSIGCEKVQGYFLGRPQPFADAIDSIISKGFQIAELDWLDYYDQAGKINLITDRSMALLEDDGRYFSLLFASTEFYQQLKSLAINTLSEVERVINSKKIPLAIRLRDFIEVPRKSCVEEVLFFSNRGQYLRFSFQLVAQHAQKSLFKISLINLSADTETILKQRLDCMMRDISALYNDVYVVNYEEDYVEPILFSQNTGRQLSTRQYGVEEIRQRFIQEEIHPDDRARYREYVAGLNAKEKPADGQFNFDESFFRTKDSDGNYTWKQLDWLPEKEREEVLFCLKRINLEEPGFQEALLRLRGSSLEAESFSKHNRRQQQESLLWRNLMAHSRTCYFWKDKERRFINVSQSFLDYYGITSPDEIVGKTDEEMHWHIDDQPYRSDELDIICKGAEICDVPGNCIIKGVVHPIVCSKWPIYENGRIIGLMGYFLDADNLRERTRGIQSSVRIDMITGLMNRRGFAETFLGYAEQKEYHERHFGLILLQFQEYGEISKSYGVRIANAYLRLAADKLCDVCGRYSSIARLKGAMFGMLSYFDKAGELENRVAEIVRRIDGAYDIHHYPVTMHPVCSITLDSEAATLEAMCTLGAEKLEKFNG